MARGQKLVGLIALLPLSVGISLSAPNPVLASSHVSTGDTGTPLPAGRPVNLTGVVHESVAAIMARDRQAGPQLPRVVPFPGRLPNGRNVPANRQSANATSKPDPHVASRAPSAQAAQTVGTQLLGATTADSGFYPPDPMGTVGPTQYIVMVNGRIRSFNKTSGTADGFLDSSTDSFWGVLPPAHFTSDPRIRYDRLSGRWFFTMITVTDPGTANLVLIAHSDTSTITSSTKFTRIVYPVDNFHPGCLWDYDTLGIDENALYIGGDLFCGDRMSGITSTSGLVLGKTAVLSGHPLAFDFTLNEVARSCSSPGIFPDGPLDAQGVDNYDPASTVGYFAGRSRCFGGELTFARINNPGGTRANPPTGRLLILASPVAPPVAVNGAAAEFGVVPVTAQGSTSPLEANDNRLLSAHLRNGHLWTAHNICVDSTGAAPNDGSCPVGARDASRWYDITNLDTSPALNQSGTVFDPAATNPRFYWMPSVMVSGQGHVAMGTSAAGGTEFAEAATMGRLAGDAPGTMNPAVIYQPSTFTYNNPIEAGHLTQRWGDYSYTSLDPNDDMTMWTIQEFTNASNSWGVEAVQLKAPPPLTPAPAGTFNANQCSVTVDVTGTSSNGSGFYDPGANLPNHLQASVSGGVTINHATYVSPTHVTLDINTQGVAAGPKDLTITNPDGQAVTATGFLNVQAAAPTPACPPLPNPVLITAAGSDNALWQQKDLGGWNSLGGYLVAAPAVVSVPNGGAGAPLYIGLGGDHDLWVRTASQPWRPLDDSPVYCIDNPAAVISGTNLVVACQGGDHALYTVKAPVIPNVPPVLARATWQGHGGILTAGPAAAFVVGRGAFDIMVVGGDKQVWEWNSNSYSATGFYCSGHPALATDSGNTSYFACRGLDGALWWSQPSGATTWSPATSLGGQVVDGPAIAANLAGPTFYVQGVDGVLYERGSGPSRPYVNDGGSIKFGTGAAALF
jgi:hypothetical protein